jgi:16S rRNA (guanine1516-N2)-methyltransferase
MADSERLAIWAAAEYVTDEIAVIAQRLNVKVLPPTVDTKARAAFDFLLCLDTSGWYLAQGKSNIQVDFIAGANHHRRLHGGGRGQLLAKAVGLKSGNKIPSVIDATAGLGRDAFVLAGLGCQVTLIERSPLVHQLLQDGLARAVLGTDQVLQSIVGRMHLQFGSAFSMLPALSEEQLPDVIYIDPMFPDRKKKAAVKKDMVAFHALLGADDDADALLDLALQKAACRVVVKRPRHAPCLAGKQPSLVFEGDSTRFDVYTLRSLSLTE